MRVARRGWAGVAALVLGIGLRPAPARAQFPPPESGADVEPMAGSLAVPHRVAPGEPTLPPSPGAGASNLGADSGFIPRAGRLSPVLPADVTRPGRQAGLPAPEGIRLPEPLPITTPRPYGPVSLPEGPEPEGPASGLSLDEAIERLVRENLDLRTQFFELPEADADILTASLRANPLFYADATLVPYGSYSDARPGGQTQYDVSVTYPLDVTHKRRARTEAARRARRVLEAQYQDAVRLQIDNLYTAFVDALAAREAVRYASGSIQGLTQFLATTRRQRELGSRTEAEVSLAEIQLRAAQIGLRDAEGAVATARRRLGLLLNLTPAEAAALEVRGALRVEAPAPPPVEALVQIALNERPDLGAYRLGIARADADVRLAQANRLTDLYVLYAPYVFQNNAPFNKLSATSWSVAVTVPMPLYNRNQGNIRRAQLNAAQTRSGLQALERRVVAEVEQAAQEYALSRQAVADIEAVQVPEARLILERASDRYRGGQIDVLAYLEARRAYNEVVHQYRDALVRHRRSMLDLNTAVGRRISP